MNQKYTLTQEGLKNLQDELKQLTQVARVENIRALQEARAQGDLSENADYDAAIDAQARIAAEIKEVEDKIRDIVRKYCAVNILHFIHKIKLCFNFRRIFVCGG